jgi:hypothetical protein
MDELRATFFWIIISVLVVLTIIERRLPKATGDTISVYEAGMLSVYLVALAWGFIEVVGGKETGGWLWIVSAAGLFGSRMYFILNGRK